VQSAVGRPGGHGIEHRAVIRSKLRIISDRFTTASATERTGCSRTPIAQRIIPPRADERCVAVAGIAPSWRSTLRTTAPSTAASVAPLPPGTRARTCLTTSGAPAT
jgi:hypothetical protein